jgi:hypothetical protein
MPVIRIRVWMGVAMCSMLVACGMRLDAQTPPTGRQLYQTACAGCHGTDGTGMPQTTVGFSDGIPDFTDCSYNSREAAQDWFAVVAKGGPVRRFSRRMPAYEHALSTGEIERVVDYVREFCADNAWPRGELNLPRATDTEKAFPEDEYVISSGYVTQKGSRAATAAFVYEKRFGARNQWELVIPVGTRELTPSKWSGGQVGDIEIAFKRALLHDGAKGYIVSGGLEVILPTGDVERGFGDGTAVYGGYLAAAQAFPANFFIQAQAGAEYPVRDVRDPEAFGRAVVGTTIFTLGGRAFSPMAEVSAIRPIGIPGSKADVDWIPQAQFALTRRQHILASVGLRLPVTNRATRSREFVFYVLWDWFDGGLFTGW